MNTEQAKSSEVSASMKVIDQLDSALKEQEQYLIEIQGKIMALHYFNEPEPTMPNEGSMEPSNPHERTFTEKLFDRIRIVRAFNVKLATIQRHLNSMI